jgi:glycolate oxidase iron-sulfur subunit
MRTQFTSAQLDNPDTNEVEQIIRKCVHCGFCNATCPTFQITGNELDGPRGRIYLLKDMLENESRPSKQVVSHIDSCLSCLSCKTTCPSGVDYMHLIEHGRAYIEQNHQRGWYDRILRSALAWFLPNPGRFRVFMKLAKRLALFKNFLPRALHSGLNLASANSIYQSADTNQTFFPAQSAKMGSVALLAGCTQQVLDENINEASIRLLNKLGYDVNLLADIQCCGAVEHHLGRKSLAEQRMKSNIRALVSEGLEFDTLISNASGCGTMLKDYAHLFRNDSELAESASAISKKTMDICEFLERNNLKLDIKASKNIRVAYQSPCSMQHGQKVSHQAPTLLAHFGFTLVNFPEPHLCCGSAGTYNILQAETAEILGQRKSVQLESSQAEVVASANMGCMLQLRQYSTLPYAHTVELLDWASGGPIPADLKNHKAFTELTNK